MPVIVVLTVSGMVMSYKAVSDLIFTLTGNEPPTNAGPSAQAAVKVPEPPAGATPLGFNALFAEAQKQVPAWESISLRMGGGPRGGGQREGGPRDAGPRGSQPGAMTFSIKEQGAWPLFASAQVSLSPFTAEVLRRETFADSNSGRQIRTWLRFLHTGQALGWAGQLVAGLASLAGAFLMWTGLTLSWRRFFRRRSAGAATEQDPGQSPVIS
jgi:uncharacterized iron-regulated membrane protein